MDLRSILALPAAYRAFTRLVVGNQRYVAELVRAGSGDRVLDMGCGPADVLEFFPPDVSYVGIDVSEQYIESARARFGVRGRFVCAALDQVAADEPATYDVVMGHGVLHHLSDTEARKALDLARTVLKPGGRLITVDPCFVPQQSAAARWLVSKDRGEFVRQADAYAALASKAFAQVRTEVRHDLLRIPYTHVILRCS